MKTIEAYETTDGKLFTDDEKAYEHQQWVDFEEWYKTSSSECHNALYSTTTVDAFSWLKEHREFILEHLRIS